MKPIFLASCLCLIISHYSQAQSSVGDVRYSILEPEVFIRLNEGWVLMDGAVSAKADSIFRRSRLHTEYGLSRLPDARGLFIRAMNGQRDKSAGDADGDRSVGEYQSDEIASHTHKLSTRLQYFAGWGGSNLFSGPTPGNPVSVFRDQMEISVTASSGNETRPKNIALYAYIKIN